MEKTVPETGEATANPSVALQETAVAAVEKTDVETDEAAANMVCYSEESVALAAN